MNDDVILSLDLGTLSVRAIVFGPTGDQRFVASRPLTLERLDDQRVEQDPNQMLSAVKAVLQQALDACSHAGWTIVSAGLAVQRSSVLAWDVSSHQPRSAVLSWQDRRGTDWLAQAALDHGRIQQRTGLPVSPHYGATKLAWLQQHVLAENAALREADRPARSLAMGPLAAWIVATLTETSRPWVDFTNAARTQLVSLDSPYEWDIGLLQQFGVSPRHLPEIGACRGELGRLRMGDIPLTAVCGDQYAAFYADGFDTRGRVIANLGTGGFVMTEVADRSTCQMIGLLESPGPLGRNLWEGTVNGVGAAIVWAAGQHGLDPACVSAWEASFHDKSTDLVFVNRVGGLGSPWWEPSGASVWIDRWGQRVTSPDSRPAMQAVVESIAFLVATNFAEIRRAGVTADRLVVTGGLSRSLFLLQALADLTGVTVHRSATADATARGIAQLANLQDDAWQPAPWMTTCTPRTQPGLAQRYQRFCRAIRP